MVEPLAVEQAADDLERLLHAAHLLADGGPVHPAGRLVERLAGADPEEGTSREQRLERHERLRGDRGVVAVHRRGDARADRDPLRGLPGRPEHDPGVPRLSRFPPRLKMVAQVEPVEAGALGLDGLSDDVGGGELLGGELGPVARLGHGDSCFDVPRLLSGRRRLKPGGRPYVAARRCGL
ncbi:MAG TPA: hypothetical protein VK387_02435 [Thermoleophilaceae bacterium]|nr:hypothetical protein [Thermoleophilaceae bacterium]